MTTKKLQKISSELNGYTFLFDPQLLSGLQRLYNLSLSENLDPTTFEGGKEIEFKVDDGICFFFLDKMKLVAQKLFLFLEAFGAALGGRGL